MALTQGAEQIMLDKASLQVHHSRRKHMNNLLIIARWWWSPQQNAA